MYKLSLLSISIPCGDTGKPAKFPSKVVTNSSSGENLTILRPCMSAT